MTGTGAADAVTAGTPLSARAAITAPKVMSIFLIVVISPGPAGDPPDVPVCLRLDGGEVPGAAAGSRQRARRPGGQVAVPVGNQRAQPGAGPAGHAGPRRTR